MHDVRLLAQDYRWFPYRLDPSANRLQFVKAERSDHRAVTFLDGQFFARTKERKGAAIMDVARSFGEPPSATVHFIFHTAFCCSTLVARAFDLPGVSMGLKEPLVLNDLAGAALAAGRPDAIRPLLQPVLQLLSRPFGPQEKVVVKPSNVANALIDEIMSQSLAGAALFMSSPLEDFLRSIAKKGLFARIWARRQLRDISRLSSTKIELSEKDRWELSDLQVAALVWIQQRELLAKSILRLPNSRAASLESTALLADPAAALSALGRFFQLNLTDDIAQRMAAGPIFREDSKRLNRPFDAAARQVEHDRLDELLSNEIQMVLTWATALASHFSINTDLGNSLAL